MTRALAVNYSDYSQRAARFLALVTLALTCLAANASRAAQPFSVDVEERVVALTNEFRAESSLQPVESEARLKETARAFAAYLAGTGRLDHEADGATPEDRVKRSGYSYCMLAENLASEFNSRGFTVDGLARNFVQGWRDSPTHRANLLAPDVTHIGVGVARNPKDGEYFVVQVFARPLAAMLKFRVTNRTRSAQRYDYRRRSITIAPRQTRTHQSCAPGELRLAGETGIRPKEGGRYGITEAGGAVRIQEE